MDGKACVVEAIAKASARAFSIRRDLALARSVDLAVFDLARGATSIVPTQAVLRYNLTMTMP